MRDSTANDFRIAAPPASFGAALRAVTLPFVVTRVGVLLIGVVAAALLGDRGVAGQPSAWRVAADPVRNLLARWDAFWYLDIATRGYHWNGNPLEQQNVVFFPLLPLLMRAVGAAIGGPSLAAGLVVSLAAFLPALCYLWRWTAERIDEDAATGAVWLLSAFPSAIYFSAVYTESLYLLIIVAACYYADRRRFVRASVFGLLAGFSRPNGVLLSIPVGWIAFAASRPRADAVSRTLATLTPAIGIICFSAYLAWRFGNATAWLAGQAAWPDNLGVHTPQPPPGSVSLWWIPNAIPLALAVVALAPLTTMLGAAYGLFVLGNLAPPLLRHGLMSMGRFCSVMFPVFVWLAARVRGRTRTWLIVAFGLGQAILAALFFTWHPIV